MSDVTEDTAVDLTNTLNKSDDEITQTNPADELSALKERARIMGIPFSGNIGIDALRKRINDRLNGVAEEGETNTAGPANEAPKEAVAVSRAKSKAEVEQELREKLQAEALALVRCRIYNLNPSKMDLPGEIISVGNRYIGTVRKFIPFGEATENGYHIPKVLYDDLVSRQFQHISTKNVKGRIEVKTRMVPEYNIVVLPSLTEAELAELALNQAAAERVGRE